MIEDYSENLVMQIDCVRVLTQAEGNLLMMLATKAITANDPNHTECIETATSLEAGVTVLRVGSYIHYADHGTWDELMDDFKRESEALAHLISRVRFYQNSEYDDELGEARTDEWTYSWLNANKPFIRSEKAIYNQDTPEGDVEQVEALFHTWFDDSAKPTEVYQLQVPALPTDKAMVLSYKDYCETRQISSTIVHQ